MPVFTSSGPLHAPNVRRLLAQYLRTAADFDAFCIDYFPEVHRQFSPAMSRMERTSLLLLRAPSLARIVDCLNAHSCTAEHTDVCTFPAAFVKVQERGMVPEQSVLATPEDSDAVCNDPTLRVGSQEFDWLLEEGQPAAAAEPSFRVPMQPAECPTSLSTQPSLCSRALGCCKQLAQHRLAAWSATIILLAGVLLTLLAWRGGLRRTVLQPQAAYIAESGQHGAQPQEPDGSADDPMILAQALEQAQSEQHSYPEELGLFRTVGTLDALKLVIKLFTDHPDYEPAITSRELIDHLQKSADLESELEPLRHRLRDTASRIQNRKKARIVKFILTDDVLELALALNDQDSDVRDIAIQRLTSMNFRTKLVEQALRMRAATHRYDEIMLYALLKRIGSTAKPPIRMVTELSSGSEQNRLKLIRRLGQWPFTDAIGPLLDILKSDSNLRVQRAVIDALTQSWQQTGSKTALADTALLRATLSRLDSSQDSGLRIRQKLLLRRTKGAAQSSRSRSEEDVLNPSKGLTWVTFGGDPGVVFALDGVRYTVPTKIQLRPGPYRISYRARSGISSQLCYIPFGLTHLIKIPVTRREQKIPIVN